MVHATANLVSPVAQTCSMHNWHSKKRVLQIFFNVSCALFLFAIQGTWIRTVHKTQHFRVGNVPPQSQTVIEAFNVILVIYGSMHHVRELGICSMITYQTQIVHCSALNYSLGSVSDLNSFASINSFNALH